MLNPADRVLYTEALVPPDGYELDAALATTYSMDLTTLLSVPLQLVMHATEDVKTLLSDPVALYEALQRAASRVMVLTQRGGIHAPESAQLLYPLLESMIFEVEAPGGGAFHPKCWILRFVDTDSGEIIYRLLVSSRNITSDRSWDTAVTLEGVLTGTRQSSGEGLAKFVQNLGSLHRGFEAKSRAKLKQMLSELGRVDWELPDGFDDVEFHPIGLGGKPWRPPPNDALVVISPFITREALSALANTSESPVAVVSRSTELSEIFQNGEEFTSSTGFETPYVLHEAAESDEGEDVAEGSLEIGLHAKVYLYESGDQTHLVIGSANATSAALLAGNNVELLVELRGPRRWWRIRDFLDQGEEGGFSSLLLPWSSAIRDPSIEQKREVERILDTAKKDLLGSALNLKCKPLEEHHVLEIGSKRSPAFEGIDKVFLWPVTLGRDRAVDGLCLGKGKPVTIPVYSVASVTGLIAVELTASGQSTAFVLNLEVEGLPEDRERIILRHVVKDQKGFLRYMLLLLAGLGEGSDVGNLARALNRGSAGKRHQSGEDMPLLEEMVRAYSRDPRRLFQIKRLVDDLKSDEHKDSLLPENFLGFWAVFEEALDGLEK